MEEDILGKVLEVEKQIRQRLDIEKEKAAEWLAKAREDAEQEVDRTKKEMEGSLDAAIAEAGAVSAQKASRMIAEASLAAEKLEGVGTEKLREIVLRHISTILSGE